MAQKCSKTGNDVDVNKLNDQFVNFKVPTFIGNLYYDLCCVTTILLQFPLRRLVRNFRMYFNGEMECNWF